MNSFTLGVLSLVAALASPVTNAQDSSRTFIIGDVRVFDGDRTLPHRDVIVDAGIIRSVGPYSTARRRGRIVHEAGATLLPGLIDAHTHTTAAPQLEDALRFGVTTIPDMWTPANEPALRDAAARRNDVADFRSAGILPTVPGCHGTEFGVPIPTVAGPDAADAFVADRVAHGADYLKIVFNGVRTARAGMPNIDAAGVDGFAHVWREAGDAPAAPAEASIDERAIRHIIADEVDAWNAGDAHAYARHFASDGTFTNVYGRVFEGHDAFERRHADTFSTFFKGSRRRETIRRFKFITPDVAIVDVDTEVRGFGPMPPGVPVIDGLLRTRLEQVFVRHEGEWWIAAYHNVAVAP